MRTFRPTDFLLVSKSIFIQWLGWSKRDDLYKVVNICGYSHYRWSTAITDDQKSFKDDVLSIICLPFQIITLCLNTLLYAADAFSFIQSKLQIRAHSIICPKKTSVCRSDTLWPLWTLRTETHLHEEIYIGC